MKHNEQYTLTSKTIAL